MKQNRILFVCMGNICRSPTAEAVFRSKATQAGLKVYIDSAGTTGYHVGEAPDSRSRQAGEARGYRFQGQVARQLQKSDFRDFDYLFAMDAKNLEDMLALCPDEFKHKVSLFLSLIDADTKNVPDPYYGGENGFTEVLDLIEAASDKLVERLQESAQTA